MAAGTPAKADLLREVEALRQRVATLEAEVARYQQADQPADLFRTIIEASREAIAISDPEGRLIYVNRAHEELFGRSLDEARTCNYRDYYPPESIEVLNEVVAPALARGESWEGELEAIDTTGRRFPLWERADAIRDAEGNLLYAFGLMHDITADGAIERERHDRLAQLEALMETTPAYIYFKDAQCRHLSVSRMVADFFGIGVGDIVGKTDFDLLPEAVAERTRATDEKVLKTGKPLLNIEEPIPTTNGQPIWSLTSKVPYRDSGGRIAGLVGVSIDITDRRNAQQARRESEERLRRLFDGLPTPTFCWQRRGDTFVLIDCNEAADYLGQGKTRALLGKTLEQLHGDEPDIHAAVHRCFEAQTIIRTEGRRRMKASGVHRHLKATYVYVPPDLVMIHVEDITQQREAESAYRSLMHSSVQGLTLIQDERLVFVNEAIARIFGYSVEELLDQPAEVLLHPDDRDMVLDRLRRRLAGEQQPTRYEARGIRKSGEVCWLDISASRTEFRGRPAIQGATIDITDRKRAEQLLRIERDLAVALSRTSDLHAALDHLLEATLQIDGVDCGGVYIVDELTGNLDLMASRDLSDEFVEAVRRIPSNAPQARIVQTATPRYSSRNERIREGESRRTAEGLRGLAIIPVHSQGRVLATLNLASRRLDEIPLHARDALETIATYIAGAVTQLEAEQALRNTQRNFQNLFDALEDLVVVLDDAGGILHVNPAVTARLGYTLDELRGRPVIELHPPSQRDTAARIAQEMLAGTTDVCRVPLLTRSGEEIPVETKITRGQWDGRVVLFGISRDTTDRERAARALRESEERFRLLAEHMPGVVYICRNDERFTVLYINRGIERDLGYSAQQALNNELTVLDLAHPDDVAEIRRKINEAVDAHKPYRLVYRMRHRDGEWRWCENFGVGVYRDGELAYLEGYQHDITDRKRAEIHRRELEAQLQQTQKMEALGQLAGGIAHEFNNLITTIFGYTDLARGTLDPHHPAVRSLDRVAGAAEQASGVTRALLTFSHKTPAEKQPVDLQTIIAKSVQLLERLLPSPIQLVNAADADVPMIVNADATQIQQVIINLAINARDAMPNGGTVRIATVARDKRPAGGSTLEGPVVQLTVSDDGTGIPADVHSRIFEPFFTTKQRGKGTGLGLAIVHSIVRDHDGDIDVDSEPGHGTTVSVWLPRLDATDMDESPDECAVVPRGGGELILLAEDDAHIRRILASALSSLDYDVRSVGSGDELLARLDRIDRDVRLLVLDLEMPRRNGLDCLREIRARGNRTPAILMTATVDVNLEDKLDPLTTLLRKPFQIDTFGTLVGRILQQKSASETAN